MEQARAGGGSEAHETDTEREAEEEKDTYGRLDERPGGEEGAAARFFSLFLRPKGAC